MNKLPKLPEFKKLDQIFTDLENIRKERDIQKANPILENKDFKIACAYHNFITDLVFDDENPMLLHRSNPEKFDKLTKQVAELVKNKYHYDQIIQHLKNTGKI